MIRPRIILLFIFLSLAAISGRSADTLFIDKEVSVTLEPGRNYSYLVDRNATLSIEGVLDAKFRSQITDSDLNEADEASVVWVKLDVKNVSSGSLSAFLYWEPNGTAYIEEDSQSFVQVRTGYWLPFDSRDVQITDPMVSISLSGGATKTIYLRIEQTEANANWFSNLDAFIVEGNAWMRDVTDRNWQFGVFFGILIFMLVYNLIFYFSLKDRSYLMYVFVIGLLTLVWANANMFTFRYIYPNADNGRDIGGLINYFSMCLMGIAYILFTRYYLRTKELLPRWNKVLWWMVGVSLVLFLLGIIVWIVWGTFIGFTSITLSSVLFMLISVFTAISAIKKKYTPAWYFIIGNGVLGLTLLLTMTRVLPHTLVFGYISLVQAGSLVQVMFFSLGLAKRISVIRDDREKAQEEIIGQLRINEELKTKVNRELEQKVAERTSELSEQKKIVEERNKDILDSITYAKRLQQAILPSQEIWDAALKESFIFYRPKDIVAGDFYWMEKKKAVVYLAAADCTGHGVPGALVSVVCSNALNRAINEFSIDDPGKLLDKTRELVLETFSKSSDQVKDGMDISLVRIDFASRTVTWAGANNPLWYVSGSSMNEIKANKQPIGVSDSPVPFTSHTIILNRGDVIYLFTDGFADQFGGPKGKKFKYKPLQELLLAVAPLSMDEQKVTMENTFAQWKGSLEQIDDVCIIGVRI